MADNTLLNSGIYSISAPSGNQYIGSAVNFIKRWSRHRRDLQKGIHCNPGLQNAYNKYGLDALEFRKLLICSRDNVIFYEQRALDVLLPKYNSAKVAGNCSGVVHTEETRRKLSAIQRSIINNSGRFKKGAKSTMHGKKHSEATREKQSIAAKARPIYWDRIEKMRLSNLGATVPQDRRDKISNAQKGIPKTAEQRLKLSAAAKLRWAKQDERNKQSLRTKAYHERVHG